MKKTWFITGCDSGMGHAVAEVVLERGDQVVVTALNIENVRAILNKFPDAAIGFQLNVTNTDQVRSVVADAIKHFGKIDVLFNNAGYGIIGAAEESTEKEYRPMFEVNFFGMAAVTKEIVPHMRKNRSGVIFSTSSLGGYAASPGFAFYAASKFAVEGFSDALAQEVKPFGINVMIIEAGSFRTNFAGASLKKPLNPVDDYKNTPVASTFERMRARDGAQPNDPRKLGLVLHELSRREELPLRMPLGEDALSRVVTKAKSTLAEFEKWKDVTLSVAFDK